MHTRKFQFQARNKLSLRSLRLSAHMFSIIFYFMNWLEVTDIIWLEERHDFGNKFQIYILLINNQIDKIISDSNLSKLTNIQMQTQNKAPEDK